MNNLLRIKIKLEYEFTLFKYRLLVITQSTSPAINHL